MNHIETAWIINRTGWEFRQHCLLKGGEAHLIDQVHELLGGHGRNPASLPPDRERSAHAAYGASVRQ
jgi:hypothetical protein